MAAHVRFQASSPSWLPPSPSGRLARRSAATTLCCRARSSRLRINAMSVLAGDPVREWILQEGGATVIQRISAVGGGCISTANRYDTDAGAFFVKTNRDFEPEMFEAEAAGLDAMFSTHTIRVPKPLKGPVRCALEESRGQTRYPCAKVGCLPGRGSFIILEFIEAGGSRDQVKLGRKLAEMHKAGSSDKGFGFHGNNTIGSTPQVNPWTPDWVTFFRDSRLGYQLELVKQQYGDTSLYEKGQKILENLSSLLGDVDVKPCLLHGDLWSGNISSDTQGAPVILDPACYYGHNEAEFGMSWCANFGSSFYKAYFEVMPRQAGFEKRVELYKLYHYLNHYNMFGSGYRSSCTAIVDKFV